MPVWSNHAIERALEYGISVSELLAGYKNSVQQTLSERQQAYKFSKYGMRSLSDMYFWDETTQLLFTVTQQPAGRWLVQTVTRGRGNFFAQKVPWHHKK